MSISILNRGASGGMKPELTVTAPSGSTIDLLRNGIIIDTYTLGASETEHTFVVRVGTYTVKGTLGADNKSTEVVIDSVGHYKVVIDYYLWLYREGDEFTDVTGGYGIKDYSDYITLTKNSDHLLLQSTRSNASAHTVAYFASANKVQVAGYSKLRVLYDRYVKVSNNLCNVIVTVTLYSDLNKPSDVWSHGTWVAGLEFTDKNPDVFETDFIKEFDVSSVTDPTYITVDMMSGYYVSGTVWYKIKAIWLE